MLLGTAVSVLVYLLVNKERLKHQLLFERLRTRKLHELDMMKFRFFTNISHEIRTPLTLIIGPLEKMLNQKLPENESRNMLEIMHRNTKQLLTLINQLLDYRKLEAGSLKLELKEGEIVSYHEIGLKELGLDEIRERVQFFQLSLRDLPVYNAVDHGANRLSHRLSIAELYRAGQH